MSYNNILTPRDNLQMPSLFKVDSPNELSHFTEFLVKK